MTQETPVPRLDLAPKLKRPLSLWNPLDYLRLLYWVFYFPQALRWYVDNFGGGYITPKEMNWRKGLKLLQENTIHRNLFLQGLLPTVIAAAALVFYETLKFTNVLSWPNVAINMTGGMALSAIAGAGLSASLSVTFGVTRGVPLSMIVSLGLSLVAGVFLNAKFDVVKSVAFSLTLSIYLSVALSMIEDVAFGVLQGILQGVTFSLIFNLAYTLIFYFLDLVMMQGLTSRTGIGFVVLGVACNIFFSIFFGMIFGMVFGVVEGLAFAVAFGVAFSVVSGMVGGFLARDILSISVTASIAVLRPESWLVGLCLNIRPLQKCSLLLLRITSLPIPYFSFRLKKWLQQDWETGLYNANQMFAYTLQFIPVVKVVNQVLNKIPSEQIIYRVDQLAKEPFEWNLVRFLFADLNETLIPFYTRLETPARATVAGFWYLYQKRPLKAEEAFAVILPILYGEEMYALAQNLAVFHNAEDFDDIVNIPVETLHVTSLKSSRATLLRPTTWQAISNFHHVVEDAQIVKRSVSRTTRSFTLNRALGELTNIVNNSETLPQAERGLIVDIAQTWQTALLQIAGEVGEVTITQPVRNPYIIGDPVMGKKFVGREEVMRELEELWLMGEQLQSVVIYGHRRMGKTSILRNAAKSVGSGVKVAYVNMLNAGNISEGVGEVLMAICDAVSEAINVPPPDDEKLLKLPERTFERYLKQVVGKLQENSLQGLIIAIDEFEKIEELITEGKIPENFLGYLRGLLQMNSQIAFAFAGLHTLEEMTADYFQPFFASVITIHVGFMERAVTRQILANPVQFSDNNVETLYITSPDVASSQEDFLLDYKPEALDKIYEFTHGQPYLVQLIGFVLVRRYNDLVFEMGRKRDSVFTVEDVEAVINNTEFFKRGRYYFDGVWSQAKQGAVGQQAILRVLAPHPKGLSYEDVIREVSTEVFDEESLKEAIKTLKNHDVVEETQGQLCIIVELFRRWLVLM